MTAQQADRIDPSFVPTTEAELVACLASWEWRMFSGLLYKIMVKGEEGEDATVLPFKPNRAQQRFLRRLHTRNVILKARQLGFCLDRATRVLTADLRWVRIDSLKPGDEVVACDERVPGGRGAARKMRTAAVQAVRTVRREGFRLRFADGREVICTAQHPWLARSGDSRQPFWRAMDRSAPNAERALKVGHHVRSVCVPWGDATYDDGWFGGIVDGEGCMAKPDASGAEVNVSQRQGAVWERMKDYAASRGYHARIESDAGGRTAKHGLVPVPKLCFTRMDELFRLIGQTRPSRMIERRFWEGKELPGKRNADSAAWSEIVAIEPVGCIDMVDLQTSTGTYIAEGFVSHNTTLIAILWLDHALFNEDQRVGIIAHNLEAAEEIFRDKVKFAYHNLPEGVRDAMPLARETAKMLLFEHNNSAIRVATSMRSGTIHRLHISEMGKIAAKFPEKAKEIVTGSLPAVPQTGVAIIESTSEGQSGEFYSITTKAEELAEARKELTLAEYRFHFFPWWEEPNYEMDPRGVRIAAADHEYFDRIERDMDCRIGLRKRAWYVSKRDIEFSGDAEKMWREMPSTPKECWQKSSEGTYFAAQLSRARIEGRISKVPYVQNVLVNTFWDIGSGDGTAIWLHQMVGTQHRFIGFIEDWAKGYNHYVKALRATGYLFGGMFLPHDAKQVRQLADRVGAPLDMLYDLAPDWNWQVVPRVHDFAAGIQMTRTRFSEAWFNEDDDGVRRGLEHIAEYRKKWNKALGVWSDEPDKDNPHTEAADALRQWAQGFDASLINPQTRLRRRHSGGMAA